MSKYQKWVHLLPKEFLDSKILLKLWGVCSVVVAFIFLFLVSTPKINAFVQLKWELPAIIYLFSPAVEIIGAYLFEKKHISESGALACSLLSSAFLELFFALTIVSSSWEGGAIIACLFLFSAAYHGFFYRAELSAPYMPILTIVTLLIALLANHELEHTIILGMLIIASSGCSLMVGSFAADSDRKRAQNDRLKTAIQSQLLAVETARADELMNVLQEFATWNHDMKNSLASAEGYLLLLTPSPELPEVNYATALSGDLLDRIHKSHESLRTGLEETRKMTKSLQWRPQKLEAVPLVPTLNEFIDLLRPRFSGVEIKTHYAPETPDELKLYGGKSSLHRIIDNLIINACEGNGLRGATKILVETKLIDARVFQLSITDNGPGFTQAQLDVPIDSFQTTKENGTGLGLFAVERSAVTHCGKLTRANSPEGGAIVSLILPIDYPTPEDIPSRSTIFPQAPEASTPVILTPLVEEAQA